MTYGIPRRMLSPWVVRPASYTFDATAYGTCVYWLNRNSPVLSGDTPLVSSFLDMSPANAATMSPYSSARATFVPKLWRNQPGFAFNLAAYYGALGMPVGGDARTLVLTVLNTASSLLGSTFQPYAGYGPPGNTSSFYGRRFELGVYGGCIAVDVGHLNNNLKTTSAVISPTSVTTIAVTYGGASDANTRLYVNGAYAAVMSMVLNTDAASPLYIGRTQNVAPYGLSGHLFEAMVYTTALDATTLSAMSTELTAIYGG